MTDVTKPKFDPIALPGQPGFPTVGPRIGEPIAAQTPSVGSKTAPGPVLANHPDPTPAASPTPPAPVWVKEAIGKLFVPSRTKLTVLVACVALGGGIYAARLFTGSADGPAASAVLEPAKPDPTPATPDATPQPLPLGGLATTNPPTTVPAPQLTFDNLPAISAPTAADQFRGREASASIPNIDIPRSTNVPNPTVPVLPQPTGFNPSPSIDAPALPNINPGTIRPVDNTTPATNPQGVGGSVVVPAIPGLTDKTQPAPPVPTLPAPTGTNTTPTPSNNTPAIPSIDLPAIGGVGTGAAAPPTPAPVIPNPATTPPPPALVTVPPATRLPDPTPPGGGSIGSGAAVPAPLPAMTPPAPAGFDTVRPTPPAPVVTTSREPQTSFDVDVHTIRQGDSYASISKSYYGDVAFAEALKQYDESRVGRTAGTVHVPPVWVLRKQFPQAMRGEAPVTPAVTVPAERTPANVTPTAATGWQAPARGKTYYTPRPMTMRNVAKEAFGDELLWNRVWDLNLNLSPDAVLPQGTKVNLSADSKVGQ